MRFVSSLHFPLSDAGAWPPALALQPPFPLLLPPSLISWVRSLPKGQVIWADGQRGLPQTLGLLGKLVWTQGPIFRVMAIMGGEGGEFPARGTR